MKINYLSHIAIWLSFFIFSCNTYNNSHLVKNNFDFAFKQLLVAVEEVETAKKEESAESRQKRESRGWGELVSPRTLEDGKLMLVPSRDWTSGFFPGELWYMYEHTQDPKWEKLARLFTLPLEREKTNAGTHDMGFKMYCSFGNGYRLTKDENYKKILLESANTLIKRYKPNAKIIRSWDHNKDKWQCPVIIDNMMNMELLFWASKVTGDKKFHNIAVTHAETTMKNHFRPDFGTYHVIDYDTITGEILKRNTHQGYSDESTWSRGEAWAVYGYTMCYRETKKEAFLQQAMNVAGFIFNHPNLPKDLIPYWDYDAPDIPNEPRDVSAATVTASALYELSTYDTKNSEKYKKLADKILENLTKNYRAKVGGDGGFLLLQSTGSKAHNSEVNVPLVYADYYFLEALLRKQNLETTGKIF